MGNSASKTKTFGVNVRNKISQTTGDMQDISSPQCKLLKPEKQNMPSVVHSAKGSILHCNGFFSPVKKTKASKKSTKYTSVSRKKPKTKKVIVSKSIIGRPTNFKHLNSPKRYGDDMDNGDTAEALSIKAQMITLAALIRPLPEMDTSKTLPSLPIIPPRNSSYDNPIYLEQFAASLPNPPSPPLSSSSSSSSSCSLYSSTKMHQDIPVVSKSLQKKSPYCPSIKKGKKTTMKYVSIGKGSITVKQKKKTTKSEENVNSLHL